MTVYPFRQNLSLFFVGFLAIWFSSCSDNSRYLDFESTKAFSFDIMLPDAEMRTRVEGVTSRYGDGSTVNNLMCYVYNSKAETNALPIRTESITIQDLDGRRVASLAIDLPTAGMYDFVFIATSCLQDNNASKVWFDPSARTLNVNYDRMTANDEAADCFYYTLKNISMSSGSNHSVALRRPMAQLNLGTKDLTDYNTMSSSELKSVGVSVDGVYTSMNVMDGNVVGVPVKVAFSQSALPSGQVFPASGATYLSMNYLLVNERKDVDVTMTAQNATSTFTTEIPDVPLQRNHQTNVYGNLFTKANDFKIEINPVFAGIRQIDKDDTYSGYDLVLSFTEVNKNTRISFYDENNQFIEAFFISDFIDSNNMIIISWDEVWNTLKWTNNEINKIKSIRINTSFLKDVIKCDISKLQLTSFEKMFADCKNLENIYTLKDWDTVNVISMSQMFYNCQNIENLDLSNFNTCNVKDMNRMFYSCSSLTALDLSSFNTSQVVNMSYMFDSCSSLATLDLSNFDTSNVKDMNRMFSFLTLTHLNLSNFDTSNVTNMGSMFHSCRSLTDLDLSSFNTGKVTDMSYMFNSCSSLETLDLSNFDTSNVTNMSYMFYNSYKLNDINLSNVNTHNVTNMSYMFSGCSALTTLDLSSFNTSKVIDMSHMFYQCHRLTYLDLSNFDTSNVENMEYIFGICRELQSLNIDSFNTTNTTSMRGMFSSCYKLLQINISSFITEKVTNMSYMFHQCEALENINLSSFNTSLVIDMSYMFYRCLKLTTINLSNFDMTNVSNKAYMFNGCPANIIW